MEPQCWGPKAFQPDCMEFAEFHKIETAQKYRVPCAAKRKSNSNSIKWRVIDEHGRLMYPPADVLKVCDEKARRDEEKRQREMRELPGNVISLKDLKGRKMRDFKKRRKVELKVVESENDEEKVIFREKKTLNFYLSILPVFFSF